MKQPKRNTLTLPAALLFILAALLMALDASAVPETPREYPPAIHAALITSVSGIADIFSDDIPLS